ncbi:MAG: peptide synthase [Pirellulaceae bacterium]|nr:MAG: peptide synthase [Pirellulaceae bacterium]
MDTALTTNHNVAQLLIESARHCPDRPAVVSQVRQKSGRWIYQSGSFQELARQATAVAAALAARRVPPGARLVLMVRPGWDFVTLVFALLGGGYVPVLVDPGLGWKRIVRCLAKLQPDGLAGIPLAHWAFVFSPHRVRFRYRISVGRGWIRGWSLSELTSHSPTDGFRPVSPDTPAALIFTSGSTGPPKAVLYFHQHFAAQIRLLREAYDIQPGQVDLATFPLFGLFNGALGVTTVFPRMNFTRPARVRPEHILAACQDWKVTHAFGSPALWTQVVRYCEHTGRKLSGVQRLFSAGAAVPVKLLERLRAVTDPETQIHTPYGATEALPIASIEARQLLDLRSSCLPPNGGYCVGKPLPGIEIAVIRIDDGPLPHRSDVQPVAPGEVGELVVSGPVVTEQYAADPQANLLHKIQDGQRTWHRMGDVGYLDSEGRIWYCGRKAHRVQTPCGTLFTEPCESVFLKHPAVYRAALVGVGRPPEQLPVMVVQPWPEHWPKSRRTRRSLEQELQRLAAAHPLTCSIQHILLKKSLPVDIRHNAKIFREKLVPWVTRRLRRNGLRLQFTLPGS